jgi:hypothetical protein
MLGGGPGGDFLPDFALPRLIFIPRDALASRNTAVPIDCNYIRRVVRALNTAENDIGKDCRWSNTLTMQEIGLPR